MVRIGASVDATGPLFEGQPAKIVLRAVSASIRQLVELGTDRLDQILRPRPSGVFLSVSEAAPGKASTGNYRRNINAVIRSRNAVIDDGGVIYGPWLEGTATRNQTTRFKGYASFRRVAGWIEKKKPMVLKFQFDKAIRGLNGGV